MTADKEVEEAKNKFLDKAKNVLANKIVKASEEEFFPAGLKTCIRVLKILCSVAVFICGPIMGWLISQLASKAIDSGLFVVFLLPIIFLAIITAVVLALKTPE
jgi:hypothetical protein